MQKVLFSLLLLVASFLGSSAYSFQGAISTPMRVSQQNIDSFAFSTTFIRQDIRVVGGQNGQKTSVVKFFAMPVCNLEDNDRCRKSTGLKVIDIKASTADLPLVVKHQEQKAFKVTYAAV